MKLYVERISGKQFMHPRFWPTWLGLGCLWLVTKLPWAIQMWLGKMIGLSMFYALPRRRFISCVNLHLAFPTLCPSERYKLNRSHFISLGQGLLETSLSWWGNQRELTEHTHIEGIEHLHKAIQRGGVILLSAHFTSLELGGRLLAQHFPLHVIYRPHQNPIIEWRVARLRAKRYGKAIPRDNIREMVRSLKQGDVVWYAQDQHFHHKGSLFIPFFGIDTPTNTATSRLSSLGDASVVPFFTLRTPNGYLLNILPALENFPSSSIEQDTLRINHTIEKQIIEYPEQYLWTHRRFKDLPSGGDRYQLYRDNPPKEGSCL